MKGFNLTDKIVKEYLPKLKFVKYHRTYTVRPNKRAGMVDSFQLTVRSAVNPHEISICTLETDIELRAIYMLITKERLEIDDGYSE